MKSKTPNKRVTRVSHNQIAQLQEALNRNSEEQTRPAPESKLTPRPLKLTKLSTQKPDPRSLSKPRQTEFKESTRLPALPEQSKLKEDKSPDIIERHESPWATFEKGYECDLAGTVAVCVPLKGVRTARAIRQFSGKKADGVLRILLSMNHENVTSIQGVFRTTNTLYTLGEFDPLTLDHIVACKQYPKPNQLASLVSQLLEGLAYLARPSFRHTSLNCSSVLIGLNGGFKIGRLECCVIRKDDRITRSDLAPVSVIMMELMQKYVKADGVVGIDDPERWKMCPSAIEFLSATTSASSFDELTNHRFLTEIQSCPADLVCLAWFALISSRTFYSWKPWVEEGVANT